MKFALACGVFLAFVALTFGEKCDSVRDCQHVSCPEADYVLECHREQCTCTHTTGACTAASDCQDPNCDRTNHCVDGRCRCF